MPEFTYRKSFNIKFNKLTEKRAVLPINYNQAVK